MKVVLNPNKELVKEIQEGLAKSDNYCPCSIIRDNIDYKCKCKAFRDMVRNLEYGKTCHCGLFLIVDDRGEENANI